ncbi:MAG: ABC transporter substrate-binding protein, partial [Oscillospiraceae bacterium]
KNLFKGLVIILTKKYLKVIIIAISIIIVGLFILTRSNEGLKVFYDIKSIPSTLDPQINNDNESGIIIKNAFEGLTSINKNGDVELSVASNYSVSNDSLTYTFNLHENFYWSDKNNTNVTAHDFVFAFRRIFSPITKSPNAYKFDFIENSNNVLNGLLDNSKLGVFAPNDYTLIFKLSTPKIDFLSLLSEPSAVPCNEKFFNSTNGSYGLNTKSFISNGVYSLLSFNSNVNVTLHKNQNYVGDIKNDTEFIRFILKNDDDEIKKRFTKKTTSALLTKNLTGIKNVNNIEINENNLYSLIFNSNNNILSNQNIRKALISSVDISQIESILQQNLSIAKTILPSNIKFADKYFKDYPKTNTTHIYNMDMAKNSLNIGLEQLNISNINNLTVLVPENNVYSDVMSFISQMWQKNLGIFINIMPVDFETLQKNISSLDYDIALYSTSNIGYSPDTSLNDFTNDYNIPFTSYINNIDDAINLQNRILNFNIVLPLFTEKEYMLSNIKDIYYYPSYNFIDFRYIKK